MSASTEADGVLAATIRNCVIQRNQGSSGPGITASSYPPASLQLTVADSAVRGNRDGGMVVRGVVDALIVDSTVERNRFASGIYVNPSGGSVTLKFSKASAKSLAKGLGPRWKGYVGEQCAAQKGRHHPSRGHLAARDDLHHLGATRKQTSMRWHKQRPAQGDDVHQPDGRERGA